MRWAEVASKEEPEAGEPPQVRKLKGTISGHPELHLVGDDRFTIVLRKKKKGGFRPVKCQWFVRINQA